MSLTRRFSLGMCIAFIIGLLTPAIAYADQRYSIWNHFVQTTNNCSYGQSKIRNVLYDEHARSTTRNNQRVGGSNCPGRGDAGAFRNLPTNYIRTTTYLVRATDGQVCNSAQAWNTNGPASRQIATAVRSHMVTCNGSYVTVGSHEIFRPNWGFFTVAETVTAALTFVTPV